MDFLKSQIEERAQYDSELTERAYAELAASVTGPKRAPHFGLDDIEQTDGAVKTCLKYNGVEPGPVPENVKDRALRIEYLCRQSGTMHRTVSLEGSWYRHAFGALLGRLDTGESVALLPRGLSGYYYLEPKSGRKVKVTAATARRINDEAVFFYRPLPSKPLVVRDLVSFVSRIFDRNDYLLVLAAALVVALIGLFPAWANNIAFGIVVPSGQASLIMPIGALLLGVMVSTALFEACRNLIMERVSTKLDVTVEAATFARVLALPTDFFKQYASGNLAMRISNMSALCNTLVSILLGSGLTSLLSLIYVGQIAAYAPALALPALVVVLAQTALTIIVTWLNVEYDKQTLEASVKTSGTVTALLNGIQKIKLAGAEDRAFAKWARDYSAYARAAYNRPAPLVALPALVTFIGLIGTVVIYYLAGTTNVSIANYMAFNTAFGQTTAAVMTLATLSGQLSQVGPMLEMVGPILEVEPEANESKPSIPSVNGTIEMSGVSFRYREDGPYILRDLSFKVRSGEYVAIVGKSGCGKSTIMRLLLGFETPERGSIFYGPHDLSKVDVRSLRQHVGTVMQDGKLFMGDIASNITISTPNATLDDAWAAAEIAGVADDIRKMPMGMQTIITEGGGGVSGGQRQRLMIARAICGKRKILMFDEATSALDNKTQKHVSDSLDKLKSTRIVIAHRLSTIRHCDRIMVIDQGTIAEEGTYEELIEQNGLFAELVARQRLETEE